MLESSFGLSIDWDIMFPAKWVKKITLINITKNFVSENAFSVIVVTDFSFSPWSPTSASSLLSPFDFFGGGLESVWVH